MVSVYAAVALVVFGIAAQADAQRRNERQVRDIVRSLSTKIDDFQYGLDYQLRTTSAARQDVDDVRTSLQNLQAKVDIFDENLNQRRENRDDVQEIIRAAKDVDAFLSQNRQNRRLETDWSVVRDLINRLASNYGVIPDWSRRVSNYPDRSPGYPQMSTPSSYDSGLTGTYQLDTGRSERIADIISGTNVAGANRQDLEAKLEAPEQIALDVRGNQVVLASSKAAPVSFIADGREKTEQAGGRNLRLRAMLRGSELNIASLSGETDYTITFASADNGRTLKVTRRITTHYLRETVFAESVYTKIDQVAKLGIDRNTAGTPPDDTYSSTDPNDIPGAGPSISSGRTGEYIVPNGMVVNAVLENEINTRVSQNNDRFRLTVQSPDEFRGAVIEGYISGVGRSGQVSGRSNVTFNFERITLRNGKTYDYAGNLQAIKDQFGKAVKVDTEGTVRGESQTRETATRGGIGAGLGAIIGAIAGGGKGAAIGAIIGGSAGAGSVIVQGRDDLQLMKGSTVTIQSSSPIRGNQQISEN